TMEGLEKEKYIIFKGNVVARQGDLYIFCDSIDAYMDEATNEIERAHAKGNVKIVKKDRTSTCSEAIFDNKKGEITLKGNVTVYSGQDKLTGDVIRYFLNEDRVVVEGEKDKKARIKVTPK
ncbi:MAG TPA: LptA/OstA family protein, partial [Syntrophorhabdaceae bacterium]|nr:LptA/OstA family protein [Syntrophorhabdaceae bacterium]